MCIFLLKLSFLYIWNFLLFVACQLAELPLSFCQLTNLKTLDLFSNRLTEIPDFLHTFTQLTRLDLGEVGIANLTFLL
jgi:Leucine-rich repeat (LRR) protein